MALDTLIKDFPSQFQGKKKIEDLCSAFDIQIAELFNALLSIREKTSLDTAEGKQLDMIGDIVGLTRIDAALLCGNATYSDILDDENYRMYLKYKAYKNSNGCTYKDVIKQLSLATGYKNIKYEEDEAYPATVMLSIPLTEDWLNIGGIPKTAPAGASLLYKFRLGSTINVKVTNTINVSSNPYCGTFYCGTFPKNV